MSVHTCGGGGGIPSQVWVGEGTPSKVWVGGYPISCLGGGYSISGLGGTPSQVWGVPNLRSG